MSDINDIDAKLDDLLRRAQAEVADVDLFAPLPPNEDCPICLLPYPHGTDSVRFQSCCGKLICGGCALKHVTLSGGIGGAKDICVFCRTPTPYGPDNVKATEKHMQKQNPHAFMNMATMYGTGILVPQDGRKALEMLAQAANLGHHDAFVYIAKHYNDGRVVTEDKTKYRAFLEVAAKKGSANSHLGLASFHEARLDILANFHEARLDIQSAIQHDKVAACAGLQPALTALIKAFQCDLLPKEELEHCLRAFQASNDEMKSEDRDAHVAWMKRKRMERKRGRGNQL